MVRRFVCILLLAGSIEPAAAQNFSQFIGFGDSTIDSGWFLHTPISTNATKQNLYNASAAQGGGIPTTPYGLMNSQLLASFFGLTAIPADASGGTNYAASGATTTGALSGSLAPSITSQITSYLTSTNGAANPDALYLISGGGNDYKQVGFVSGTPLTSIQQQELIADANGLATSIEQLHADGARYIVVSDFQPTLLFANTLWSDLAAAGVPFIPADIKSVLQYVENNPTQFGLTNVLQPPAVSVAHPYNPNNGGACINPNPSLISNSWALYCTPALLQTPNAGQTYLWADDEHLTAAGQKIEADYYYSLIVAPSQISFLAEAPVKTESILFNTIQNQLPISNSNRGPGGFNVWVSGDISSLAMSSNYNGFPGDPGWPTALTAGFDFKNYGWLYGVAFSVDHTSQNFTLLPGYYTQDGASVSLYAAYLDHPLWFDVIGTFGYFHDDINRQVPLGIALLTNNGNTSAYDPSIAGEIGYNFLTDIFGGNLKQGPVAGIALQRVNVQAFTETGSVTGLSFGSQVRDSAISELGYQAAYTFGICEPFAKLVWSHEWADTNRDVMASLTTISAPAYSMPAVVLGKDWGSATVGLSAKSEANVKWFAFLTSEFAQNSAAVYSGELGVNVRF